MNCHSENSYEISKSLTKQYRVGFNAQTILSEGGNDCYEKASIGMPFSTFTCFSKLHQSLIIANLRDEICWCKIQKRQSKSNEPNKDTIYIFMWLDKIWLHLWKD